MEFRVCPRCETLNQTGAATCMECGESLLGAAIVHAEPPAAEPWWRLNTSGARLKAIGVVIALAWSFSPVGLVRLLVELVSQPVQTGFLALLGGMAGLTFFSLPLFPSGLTGFFPALDRQLPAWANIVVIGWLVYIALAAAILLARRKVLVRSIFVAFVLLVVWNTAGCYPVLQNFH